MEVSHITAENGYSALTHKKEGESNLFSSQFPNGQQPPLLLLFNNYYKYLFVYLENRKPLILKGLRFEDREKKSTRKGKKFHKKGKLIPQEGEICSTLCYGKKGKKIPQEGEINSTSYKEREKIPHDRENSYTKNKERERNLVVIC